MPTEHGALFGDQQQHPIDQALAAPQPDQRHQQRESGEEHHIRQARLHEDEVWRTLLHYKRGWFGDGSLVGINAVVLNGAVIGKGCLIGANALVTDGKVRHYGANRVHGLEESGNGALRLILEGAEELLVDEVVARVLMAQLKTSPPPLRSLVDEVDPRLAPLLDLKDRFGDG